jgi:rsbT co-antagonist protein RsbR
MNKETEMASKQPDNKDKSINQLLIELLQTRIATVSDAIERKGKSIFGKSNLLSIEEINDYTLEFMELFIVLLQAGDKINRRSAEYKALRQFFANSSQQIRVRGGNLDEFIHFVHFLQSTLLENLEADDTLSFGQTREILLRLGNLFNDIVLDVFHIYLDEKEKTIEAQQEELKHTSTPITEIWDGVLTLPIIGTLDSSRTMTVMEKLLSRIEAERAKVVVLDVTGVQAIDSQVSHHLIQMIHAIGLMGAQAILTGIRPEIARAITSLNIDLSSVTTRATLAEGLKEAFMILGIKVSHPLDH